MRFLRLTLLAGLVATGSASAAPPVSDIAFYRNASDCTAALKARVEQHLLKPPSEARNQLIVRDTELGFVYIGVAYKRGLRNPEADSMLKDAEGRWTQLTPTQQVNRLNNCTQQGQQMMDEVSGLERYLVRNRAKARVDRLLAKETRNKPSS